MRTSTPTRASDSLRRSTVTLGVFSSLFLTSATSHAQLQQLVIHRVSVDFNAQEIVVIGENFDNGGDPVVTLGADELEVLGFSSTLITATLPASQDAGASPGRILRSGRMHDPRRLTYQRSTDLIPRILATRFAS